MSNTIRAASDLLPGLPLEDVTIKITRYRENDGSYATKISTSRPVRTFYAIGLLADASAMFQSSNCETVFADSEDGD